MFRRVTINSRLAADRVRPPTPPHPDTASWGTTEEELQKFRARRQPKKEETDAGD